MPRTRPSTLLGRVLPLTHTSPDSAQFRVPVEGFQSSLRKTSVPWQAHPTTQRQRAPEACITSRRDVRLRRFLCHNQPIGQGKAATNLATGGHFRVARFEIFPRRGRIAHGDPGAAGPGREGRQPLTPPAAARSRSTRRTSRRASCARSGSPPLARTHPRRASCRTSRCTHAPAGTTPETT